MDNATQEALRRLRDRFIAEEDFGLPQFLGGIDALLPDQTAAASKIWKTHGTALRDAYEHIVKKGESIPWPEAPLSSSTVFAIAEYIKLDSPELAELLQPSKLPESSAATPVDDGGAGRPDDWSMDDFLA
ncbi:hypothetical protein B0H10DRAFT_2197823 [Mycena sp. CBHHK59/15]|nr:hypothetical protein B0H10DRAFT_1966090 [Mycena sp. CBHHK59/15]KAJ6587729.1 hypothetical protein B0H10DRAFT_2197823 [Mycena sp. CBHHK59/15]